MSQEAQIKKAAEKGDKLQVQALAKQLVSVRKQREKSFAASSKIGGISQTVTDAQTNIRMTQIMGGTAKVYQKFAPFKSWWHDLR
jgi:charged multivesicular body protein 2B